MHQKLISLAGKYQDIKNYEASEHIYRAFYQETKSPEMFKSLKQALE